MDAVLSPTNVWGVTNQGCETGPTSQRCTVLVHWNGSSWSTVTVAGEVTSVTAVGGHVFFLALTDMKFSASLGIGTPVIYEPTTKMYSFAGPNLQLTDQGPSLVVELDGHRFISGRLTTGGHAQRFYYWNGTTWTTMSVPGNVCPPGFVGDCPLVLNSGPHLRRRSRLLERLVRALDRHPVGQRRLLRRRPCSPTPPSTSRRWLHPWHHGRLGDRRDLGGRRRVE